MSETLIKVENVSKKFCKDLKRSLWYGVKDLSKELFGRNNSERLHLRKKEFWAVKDVSFEVKRGECLGLIGHNGAGKSTLLKMLNGLIKPDTGRIEMHGRIGALIELGAGFNPILTGRENIYVNGAVLGFTKDEIQNKLESIIEFAEIGEFIDTPVQYYSSGMKVRLGFAVAAQMEPDILIIDEVLAVGDVGFRIKCLNKISELMKSTAVILVSHSIPQIVKMSSSVVLLKKGMIEFYGKSILQGVEKYFDQYKTENASKFGEGVDISSLRVNGAESLMETVSTMYGETLDVEVTFTLSREMGWVRLLLVFVDRNHHSLASCLSHPVEIRNWKQPKTLKVTIPRLQFAIGRYSLNFNFHEYRPETDQMFLLTRFNTVGVIAVKGGEFFNPTSIHLISEWKSLETDIETISQEIDKTN